MNHSKKTQSYRLIAWALSVPLVITVITPTDAADLAQIQMGRNLFIQDFSAKPLDQGGDGLGPIFNESSCVACHQNGGVGGSGGVAKNARSVGLTRAAYRMTGNGRGAPKPHPGNRPVFAPNSFDDRIRAMVANAVDQFSPGFVDDKGNFTASFPMHRRGGSVGHDKLRTASLTRINSHWNHDASLSPDTVHLEREPKRIASPDGRLTLDVHVFARNTTALFGAGLIDQIPAKAMQNAARRQLHDRHVSGRLPTLVDSRIGKFGWRGNHATLLEFNESACVAELGLQSRRIPQPPDVIAIEYRNPNVDIHDNAIKAINAFVASLPRPIRKVPATRSDRDHVLRGERIFASVGCAQCHQRDLGSVSELYSDLLLHDMGYASMDTASALPQRKQVRVEEDIVSDESVTSSEGTLTRQMGGGYYGGPVRMVGDSISSVSRSSGRVNALPSQKTYDPISSTSSPSDGNQFVLRPAQFPPASTILKSLGKQATRTRSTRDFENDFSKGKETTVREVVTERTLIADNEMTYVNQEWRTPPLWGVADSAPYMHDGRAASLLEAIMLHGGEGEYSRGRFADLSLDDQDAILAFLQTLIAPTQGVAPIPPRHQLAAN